MSARHLGGTVFGLTPPASGRGRLRELYLRGIQALGHGLSYGTSVYEFDWDLLVVLDGCRPDTLRAVAEEHGLGEVGTIRSVGSCSSEWLENTFERGRHEAAVAETAMVTGNTWTDRYLTADRFAALDEVWKYAWDDDPGTVPAEAITDRTISAAREREPARLVAHYMQPHHPFVPDPIEGDTGMARTGQESSAVNPWTLLRQGEVSPDRIRAAYRANLEHVLSSVEDLLDNVEAPRVVVTADHANLFGEWGLYGHPMATPVPALLRVPWVETSAWDTGSRTPSLAPPTELPVDRVAGETDVTEQLDALGYL